MKKTIFLILILFQTYLQSQTFDGNLGSQSLNWTTELKDFNALPRVGIIPMSLKLWDNYNSVNAPSQFGTLLEINGKAGHLVSQLYFKSTWEGGKIMYRSAFYNQNTWEEWRNLLDSKSDIESTGSLKIQGNENNYILNGNVGIGIISPSFYQHGGNNKVLEVYNPNTTANSQSHIILSTGSILPNSSLGSLTWSMPNMSASNKGLAYLGVISGTNSTSANPSSSMIFATRNATASNWNPNMVLSDTGNLGIGILAPTNKLDVNGTIHSKEVKVDMSGWSDFVFKKEYELPTLAEVEKHIAENGHLKNIPSEEEVLKNGINLGEMNAKLLQKIEELTLYSIDQNKKIESQAKEIESLKDLVLRVTKIESELARK